MLMEVKNQLNVTLLSIKYALMREMLNKASFLANIVFMILNNASFIIQWIIIFRIKDNVAGNTFHEILLLWGLAASVFGFSRFFFKKAFELSDIITKGGLDNFLVQPKNVLLSSITTDVEPSAIGDMIYGYIMLIAFGFTIKRFLLFTFFTITGGLIVTCIAVITGSLSFWFANSYMFSETENSLMVNFATYPDGIFKGAAKVLLYTLVPVGLSNYIPLEIISEFNLSMFLIIIAICILFVLLSFYIFNRGLKKYSSTNLMNARI